MVGRTIREKGKLLGIILRMFAHDFVYEGIKMVADHGSIAGTAISEKQEGVWGKGMGAYFP